MKRNLLLFSLMVICSNLIFAMPLDTRKQIKMKVRVKIEHRSANLPSPVQKTRENCLPILAVSIIIPKENQILHEKEHKRP